MPPAPALRLLRARPAQARAQAGWIAALDPWRNLGYRAAALGDWLARMAREDVVWVARAANAEICAVAAVQGGFLLGGFVALLAVQPAHAGQGVGSALMTHIERDVLGQRRWLYTSCDSGNRRARRFYRRRGFVKVGDLPDLIQRGHREILLRKGR